MTGKIGGLLANNGTGTNLRLNPQTKLVTSMNEWPPYVPYLILAFICGLASFAIVTVVMGFVFGHGGGTMSDSSMMAVAAMAFAPAVMGIGIAAYMPREK